MLSALLGTILSSDFREDSLECLDSVWVYPHAGDPTQDGFVRVWGTPEQAFENPGPGSFATSYSLLKFAGGPKGATAKSATVVLWQTANPTFDQDDASKFPLEVRLAPGGWSGDQWRFADAGRFLPGRGQEAILGVAKAAEWVQDKPVKFEIKLKDQALKALGTGDSLSLALTSRLDPDTAGEGHIYKLHGRYSQEEALKPKLVVEWTQSRRRQSQ